MGTDIHGWVEKENEREWISIVKIDDLVGRRNEMVSILFGVTHYLDKFEAVAEGRGLPHNIGWYANQDYESWDADAHSPTWILWSELKQVQWLETVLLSDGSQISRLQILHKCRGWQLLFETMELFAKYAGDDNVRLVVWFDN